MFHISGLSSKKSVKPRLSYDIPRRKTIILPTTHKDMTFKHEEKLNVDLREVHTWHPLF